MNNNTRIFWFICMSAEIEAILKNNQAIIEEVEKIPAQLEFSTSINKFLTEGCKDDLVIVVARYGNFPDNDEKWPDFLFSESMEQPRNVIVVNESTFEHFLSDGSAIERMCIAIRKLHFSKIQPFFPLD